MCGFWCTFVGKLFVEDVRYIKVQVLNCEGEVCGEVRPTLYQRCLDVGKALNHIVTDFNQYSKDSGGIASIAARFRVGVGSVPGSGVGVGSGEGDGVGAS